MGQAQSALTELDQRLRGNRPSEAAFSVADEIMQVLHMHGFDGIAAAGRSGTEEDTVKQSERKAKRNSQLLAYEEKAKEIAASSLYGALEQDQDDEKARGVLFTQGEWRG